MATKTKKITAKPTGTVANPSISRTSSNTDCTVTAKWKVGSALTSKSSSKRATALEVEWTVNYVDSNGKAGHATKIVSKSINSTTTSLNPRNFVDSTLAQRHWTTNDFWPTGAYRLASVSFKVTALNPKGYAKKGASATYTFGTPGAPTVSALEHDMDSGEIFFEITAYDGSKSTAPRIRTLWSAVIEDTRKTGSARVQTKGGSFTGNSQKWDEDTPEDSKVIIDVTDRYMLAPNQYVRVTVTGTTESVDGRKSASQTIVVAYPNAASIEDITVDKLESGAPDISGRVTLGIKTNNDYATKPTTNVMLQKLRSTTATTPQQAASMGEDWADTDIVDDGECDGLSIAVAELMPTRGLHSWLRVKSWNAHEAFFTYSVPKEVTDLYTDPATASDNLHLLSLVSGDDGTSLIAQFAWTQGTDPDTGTEVSWSDDEHAWESTREPETFDTTRNDGAQTIGGVSYVGTLLIHIPELTQGETYHVRGRRYLDPEEGDRSFGGYTEDLTAKPVSSPTSVVLSAPQAIARGSDLPLSWTFDSEAPQREWYLLYGTEYTVVDPETGERDYVIGEDSWLASGTDAYGACVVRWSDLSERLDANGEIGLALRMGTGGTLVTSDTVFLRVVAPPVLSVAVSGTITAQQFPVALTCNVPASVTVILRAGSYGDGGMTGGNGGDGLVHRDQTAGDVVWQQYLAPEWVAGTDTYTYTAHAPSGLELIDGGTYTLFAQPVDAKTGLYGETVILPLSVAWANQAPRMEDEDGDAAPVTVTPSDTTDADGNRVRQCTIELAPPADAIGTETYNVYRVTPDGAYLIAEGCGLTETVVDPYAPYSGGEGAYRVAVVTVDGDVDWLDYGYRMDGRELRIDFGDEYVELPYNLTVSDSYEKDFEARRKLDGSVDGYWNEGAVRTGGFGTDLIRIMEQDKAAAVRRLGRYSGPVFVRVPDGSAYQANVTVSSIGGARREAALAVQLDATEVDLTDEFRATLPERVGGEVEP